MAAGGTELYCAECKTWTKQKSLILWTILGTLAVAGFILNKAL